MSNNALVNQKRRAILGGTAATIAGMAIAPGVFLTETAHARAADEPINNKSRWGILINTKLACC